MLTAAPARVRFLSGNQTMQTLYFLGIALGGAVLSLFAATGWSSYKHKKIPERPVMFRWFVAGLVAAGLVAYAWIFGAGGDVGAAIKQLGGSLDLPAVGTLAAGALTSLTALTGVGGANSTTKDESVDGKKDSDDTTDSRPPSLSVAELTVGMPTF